MSQNSADHTLIVMNMITQHDTYWGWQQAYVTNECTPTTHLLRRVEPAMFERWFTIIPVKCALSGQIICANWCWKAPPTERTDLQDMEALWPKCTWAIHNTDTGISTNNPLFLSDTEYCQLLLES